MASGLTGGEACPLRDDDGAESLRLFFRSNEIVQEYDRHLAAVNTITFVDENRRFVSTSDDKSLRVWEWDIPVDMKVTNNVQSD